MRFSVLVFLLPCCFKFSNGYSFSEMTSDILLLDHFIERVQNYTVSTKNEVSRQCRIHLHYYGQALREKKLWALLMFDAGTKIPSGVLSGNLVGLGNFDQCLKIEKNVSQEDTLFGKYCLGQIPVSFLTEARKPGESYSPPNIIQSSEKRMINPEGGFSAAFATCLPASCKVNDLQKLYAGVKFTENLCQTRSTQPKLTNGDIAAISFLFVILCIITLSTIYDVFLFYNNKEPAHAMLITFSVLTNGKKLIRTSNNSRQISCLHGIRVISMMWVILGHRYTVQNMFPNKNYLDYFQWRNQQENMFVMGSTVSVDTFFVLGGLLVSYGFLSAVAKEFKFNIIVYYFHRFLRLTPLFAVIIVIYVTILKHLGSGPLWNQAITTLSSGCEENWWAALLYVHNYVNSDNMCVAQTFYLAVDTQLFLLSPIILIPLKKMPRAGIFIATVLIVASMIATFVTGWIFELRGFVMANQDVYYYNKYFYFATHTRAGPWLMGIILGYCIYEVKHNHKNIAVNKILALMLWTISVVILGACVFTGHNTLTAVYDRVGNSFYLALMRPGWALGMSWVIFACVTGYGGPVNWFLSLPMFQVVSKLTYSMYLLHFITQFLISGQMRSASVFSNLQMLYAFWGDFAFTLGFAVIFTLAFESPVIAIEKIVFSKRETKKQQQQPEDHRNVGLP